MKYYLIAGEASGDLHASHLMTSITKEDNEAEFRFIGGDNMAAAAGNRGSMLRHYRELAYMGFIPVLLHLPTILKGMSQCKKDIEAWQPDVVILVDYAGFNLKIAKFVKTHLPHIRTFYYIAPKIWAWKEHRIKDFKRYVDEMFCILPFEKEFFEGKHHYPIHYVGNPTADEVRKHQAVKIEGEKPIIALLAGSRRQEITDNLPSMLRAVEDLHDYRIVIAGAPGIEPDFYATFTKGRENIEFVFGRTYDLLASATAALVTSGTATLETALFNVPQVVCYKTPMPCITRWAFNHIIKCRYISLVNLIADNEVVQELFADRFSVNDIRTELSRILPGTDARADMLKKYETIHTRLGDTCAPDNAASIMVNILKLRNSP